MRQLSFQIEALAPLAFPERKPGVQFNASLPYVPGAAIYGALGQQIGPDDFDAALFRDLRCHNAYPDRADDLWVRPLPATAIKPKGAEPNTQLRDSLYERLCWAMQEPTALIYAPTDDDGRPWEAAGSPFYTLNAEHQVAAREVQQRMLTRVAINRQRGTAQDGRLYSPLVISEVQSKTMTSTTFLGNLVVPDESYDEISAALQAITHLGARQTTGLGAVKIELASTTQPNDAPEMIMRRVSAMTRRFQDQAAFYEQLGGKPWPIAASSIFTLNLLSDAILLENGWLPTQELSPQLLEEATGIKATLLRSFTTTKTVGGFHSLWQRPKPAEVAVAMGGLYVYLADVPLTSEDCVQLAQLQLEGIGERRAEGFGQLRICEDFHVPDWESYP